MMVGTLTETSPLPSPTESGQLSHTVHTLVLPIFYTNSVVCHVVTSCFPFIKLIPVPPSRGCCYDIMKEILCDLVTSGAARESIGVNSTTQKTLHGKTSHKIIKNAKK